jgi:uncharacterized protein
MPKEIMIPPMSGAGFIVKRGQTIKVIDVEGQQIGDFVCFNLHNPRERLSTGETVIFNTLTNVSSKMSTLGGSIYLTAGNHFYSNLQNSMLEIIEDRAHGVHDLLYAPCSSAFYMKAFGEPGHKNCRDNLTAAVTPFGLSYIDIPDPINLFQNTRPRLDGTIDHRPGVTKPGDFISLKASMDCIVAVSSCAFDKELDGARINRCSPLKIQFLGD